MATRESSFVKSAETKALEAQIEQMKKDLKEQKERDRKQQSRRPALYREASAYLLKQAEDEVEDGNYALQQRLKKALDAVSAKVEADANKRAKAAREARKAKKSVSTSVEPETVSASVDNTESYEPSTTV